ncbi:3-hydroxyacyl-[acyl-carrier-protein] dehydratase FabZ-like protein [Drosera capensis]
MASTATALSHSLSSHLTAPSIPKLHLQFSTLSLPIPARSLRSLSLSSPSPRNGAVLVARCSNDSLGSNKEEIPFENRFPAFPTLLDIGQIRDILPHRFPFLLVDRVVEYNPGKSAVGIKNVTINDNFFPGHFPERPIMPGVLMIEKRSSFVSAGVPTRISNAMRVRTQHITVQALAQVGGIVMLQPEVGGSRENFFFAGINNVRFRKPVVPGDTLVLKMTLIKLQKTFGIAKMEGKAYVGGELVCEGEFLLAMGR